jgi:hypothetical protein
MCTLKASGVRILQFKKKRRSHLGVDSLWQSTKSKKKKTKKLTQIRKWRENEPQKEKTNQPMRCDLSNLVAIITLHPLCNNITSDFWV